MSVHRLVRRYSTRPELANSLRAKFSDIQDLHSRIALLDSPIRIGLVPVTGNKEHFKRLVDAAVERRIGSLPPVFVDRLLAKDTIIRFGGETNVVNHNSSIEINLETSKTEERELLEANSYRDSWDHLKQCQLHVFLGGRLTEEASPYPNIVVDPNQNDLYTSLFQTPSNESVRILILRSILDSARQQLVSSGDAQTLARVRDVRVRWAKAAHDELQTHAKKLVVVPWWKLYFRVDDIFDSVAMHVRGQFLANSKSNLHYAMGSIDAERQKAGAGPKGFYNDKITQSQDNVIKSQVTQLHNAGLRLLAQVLFGLQLPLTITPALGVYLLDQSWYSMGSIAALGVVLGLRQLQAKWDGIVCKFQASVQEAARLTVNECEQDLYGRLELELETKEKLRADREALVKELERITRN